MYKNQLQELAQRSCFSLPSYTCIREGPDHAPRFKATVNFNGEVFESPSFCTTLRQAEHAAAEVALNALASRGPSQSLAARILDETGVYKNLLQEVAQRVGAPLPSYTTVRFAHRHHPVFTCTVVLSEISFTGEPAKSKKQAEKNAAMAAWNSLKYLARKEASSSSEQENNDELEQITIARALSRYRLKEKMLPAKNPNSPSFPKIFLWQPDKNSPVGSKILPMIRPICAPRSRPATPEANESQSSLPHNFPAPGAAPYMPLHHLRIPYCGMAQPVTIRTAVPVFSAPPFPPLHQQGPRTLHTPPSHIVPPVQIRPAIPVFAAQPKPQSTHPHIIMSQVKECPIAASSAKEHPTVAATVQVDAPTAAQIKEKTSDAGPSTGTPEEVLENFQTGDSDVGGQSLTSAKHDVLAEEATALEKLKPLDL
ncbi:Double-stranded RNA-binding protein 6 [Apostasia shenzhenica]|uniref:Double-stranded RNA-binding protein 6 n=1 Tax=Apostasia shenzhenica TaxID=1088818 RepID=A0A2I0AUJ7_9ASPA|nr:Double-stranded RNA-binding protein 6 [Apostasia shenzhenica]